MARRPLVRSIVVAALILATGLTAAAQQTPSEYLAIPDPAGEPAVTQPVTGEEFIQEQGGAHEGHRVLLAPGPRFAIGSPSYGVSYHACLDTEKHGAGGEVVPKEGMSGIGVNAPTGANWYGGGCIDVKLDGQSVGAWRPELLYQRWPDQERFTAVYQAPQGSVRLTFAQLRDDDRLLIEGRVEDAGWARVEVVLRCFPGGFRGERQRFAVPAERRQPARGRLMLRPAEPWVLFADEAMDLAVDEGSRGCGAAMFAPAQVQSATARVEEYPTYLEITYPAGTSAFHLALWEFPESTNAEALAHMQEVDGMLDKSASVLLPAAEPVQIEADPGMLATGGEAAATIVLPDDPSDELLYAARKLRHYLEQMSGALLPVALEGEEVHGNRILLGASGAAAQAGAQVPEDLQDEEYVIRTAGGDLVIEGGSDLGTFYGVCGLLEDHLGVRWYVPGDPLGDCVPRVEDLAVEQIDDRRGPSFPMRWIGNGLWANMNRQNRGGDGLEAGFKIEPGIYHTQNRLLPHSEYFDEHPEYFALIDGERSEKRHCKLCYSNPDVAKAVAGSMAEMLEADPSIDLLSFSPTDGQMWCECPQCTAMDEEDVPRDQSKSRRSLIFYNRVAQELRKTHPEARILVGAYNDYNWPPADESITADPMLSVIITHYEDYCMAHPVPDPDCPRNQRYVELVHAWQDLGCDVYYYEYYNKSNWSSLPWPIVHSIKEDMPWYDEQGHKGVYTQFTTHNAWTLYPAYYVAAKLMWDVDADVDAIFDEMCNRLYGPAGPHMREYYRVQEEQMATCGQHFPGHSVTAGRWVFTAEVLAAMGEALQRAHAATDDELIQRRLAKIDLSYEYTRRLIQFATLRHAAYNEEDPADALAARERALQTYDSLLADMTEDPGRWRGVVNGKATLNYPFVRRRYEWLQQHLEGLRARQAQQLQDLAGGWRFRLDPEDVGVDQEWFAPDLDDSGWEPIEIGKPWEEQGHPAYDGFAWYRRDLTIEAEWLEREAEITFWGVDGEAWVYLNGTLLGHHEGWHEPFSVPLKPDVARAGEQNVLAVRVWDGSNQGGIYRKVAITAPAGD